MAFYSVLRDLKFATRQNTPSTNSEENFYAARESVLANGKRHTSEITANGKRYQSVAANQRRNSIDTGSERSQRTNSYK